MTFCNSIGSYLAKPNQPIINHHVQISRLDTHHRFQVNYGIGCDNKPKKEYLSSPSLGGNSTILARRQGNSGMSSMMHHCDWSRGSVTTCCTPGMGQEPTPGKAQCHCKLMGLSITPADCINVTLSLICTHWCSCITCSNFWSICTNKYH